MLFFYIKIKRNSTFEKVEQNNYVSIFQKRWSKRTTFLCFKKSGAKQLRFHISKKVEQKNYVSMFQKKWSKTTTFPLVLFSPFVIFIALSTFLKG